MITTIRQTWAFVFRNYHLIRRYISWVVVFTFYELVNAATIVLIGVAMDEPRLTITLILGVMLWNFLSAMFHEIANSISWERWEGTLEYTFMAPVSRLTHLLGVSIYAVLYSLVNFFQGILLLVSGIYYPITVLPEWLQPLSYISPATYVLSASRTLIGLDETSGEVMQTGGRLMDVLPELTILAIMGLLMVPLGLWIFGKVEAWAKRTGKLKRTG